MDSSLEVITYGLSREMSNLELQQAHITIYIQFPQQMFFQTKTWHKTQAIKSILIN
jgi:hypothetical protein